MIRPWGKKRVTNFYEINITQPINPPFFNELKIFSRQPNERQKLKEEEWNLETSTTSLRGELLVALRFGIQLVCPCV
jgi:hypothetical protein